MEPSARNLTPHAPRLWAAGKPEVCLRHDTQLSRTPLHTLAQGAPLTVNAYVTLCFLVTFLPMRRQAFCNATLAEGLMFVPLYLEEVPVVTLCAEAYVA